VKECAYRSYKRSWKYNGNVAIHRTQSELELVWCVQPVIRVSFNATTVSALHGQSTVTLKWTVLMALMSVDVVSSTRHM